MKYAREVLAGSTDQSERMEAEDVLIYATRWLSGYDVAIRETELLKQAIPSDSDERLGELTNLEGIIDDLKIGKASLDKAIEEQRAISLKYPGTNKAAEADLWIARYVYQEDGVEAGSSAFREVIRNNPGTVWDHKARSNIALFYDSLGYSDLAREVWLDAAVTMRHGAYGEKAIWQFGRLYVGQRRYDEGIKAMRDFTKLRPTSQAYAAAALVVGQLLEPLGGMNVDKAVAAYKESVKRDPNSLSAELAVEHMNRIYASIRGGQYTAISEMEKSSDLYRGTEADARARFLSIQIGRELNLPDVGDGEDQLTVLIQEYPNSRAQLDARKELVKLYTSKANECLARDDAVGAIGQYEKRYVVDLDRSGRAEALYLIANNKMGIGLYDEAHKYLQLMIDDEQLSLEEWREPAEYLHALAYYLDQEYDSALPILKRIALTARQGYCREGAIRMLEQIQSRVQEKLAVGAGTDRDSDGGFH